MRGRRDEVSKSGSVPFVHPEGICESKNVGAGTRVWAFAHVLPSAKIGRECNICDHVFVENDVTLGDRVTVKCGVQLWDGVHLEDDVFVGPNVTFSNDPFPRSKARPERFATTNVRSGASIGANASILPGVEIGSFAMVGAGAVVTRSVPARAIAVGNPARIVGYVQADGTRPDPVVTELATTQAVGAPKVEDLPARGVTLHHLPAFEDMRGALSVANVGADVPFEPQRYFLVHSVPSIEVRGEHAHRVCHQFLVCTHGACSVVVDDGQSSAEVRLTRPSLGVYMPPMTWAVQYKYTPDAVLLVLASHAYDPDDYIRTYDDFLAEVEGRPVGTAER
jgi:acetyltransferase-like isoleucine patch superfamily enzyme